MKVEVKYYAMLREAAGRKSETIELPYGSSVGDLMNIVTERHGMDFYRYVYDDQKQVRDYLASC